VPQGHVGGEFLLGDALLDLELPVLDPADVAIDDAAVVLLADELVALGVAERIFHVQALERSDRALDVLAGLVARGLGRLLDGEDISALASS
jgi:hypothetical protein